MSVLPILTWPDRRLSQPCEPVLRVTPEIARLADDMLETMYKAPGRGLAAPQVGILKRLFVMDATWKDGERFPTVCIDPKILELSDDQVTSEEGCLSIPGVTATVERADWIRCAWTTLDGERLIARLDGAAARIAQHEIDHLDGLVTLDRLNAEARADLEALYVVP